MTDQLNIIKANLRRKTMKISPISPVSSIALISPIEKRKKKSNKKKRETISDENLGKIVDITIQGPLRTPKKPL
jgi:hypothetical protein